MSMESASKPESDNQEVIAKRKLLDLKKKFASLDFQKQITILKILLPDVVKEGQAEWNTFQEGTSHDDFFKLRTDWPGNLEGSVGQILDGKFDQVLTNNLDRFEELLSTEQINTKKVREQIVDEVFGNLENVKKFMDEHYGWSKKIVGEEKDKQAEDEKENFVHSLDLEPRFGSEEEYLKRIQEEIKKISSLEEKIAFLQGLTDFKSNSYEFKSLHDRFEKADETKESLELKTTDKTLVRGLLLRSIMDTSMRDQNVASDIHLAKRLEEATNEKILENFRPDFEKMLNEGKGWGINGLDSLQLMTELNKAGIEFKWSQDGKGKKMFFIDETGN